MRNQKRQNKKLPYIQLIAAIAIFIFLGISLCSQIVSFLKDINEEAYVLYEGPATISEECQVIFGSFPTEYNEYIIRFEHNGKQIELSTRKDYGFAGDIENIYIVYSIHSNYILEIEE